MAMVGVHTEAKADMANPNLRKTVTLENGETVTMRLVGDEYGHFGKMSRRRSYMP